MAKSLMAAEKRGVALMIFYVVIIIQMHTIPTQAPNMCVDGDR